MILVVKGGASNTVVEKCLLLQLDDTPRYTRQLLPPVKGFAFGRDFFFALYFPKKSLLKLINCCLLLVVSQEDDNKKM